MSMVTLREGKGGKKEGLWQLTSGRKKMMKAAERLRDLLGNKEGR